MGIDVTSAITIDRPPSVVADYAGDPGRAPAWYVNIRSVEWLTPPPLAVGSRLAFRARFLGRELAYTYEVVDHRPGERLTMRTADGPFPMETTYTWEPSGAGGTRMTLRNRGEAPTLGGLGGPVVAAAVRRATTADLRQLKRLLEKGTIEDATGPAAAASGDRLVRAVAALVGLDVVGGLVAIADGINDRASAWGSDARLAAPWPMIAAQAVLTAQAVGPRKRPAVACSVLLSLACLVSAVSGFFDGGLADTRLARRHVAFQAVLIAWTAVVGALAADHARRRARA
jgi:uncharacterized membrane protein